VPGGDGGGYDAVLLIAYGGPERPEDVRPYLAGILRGRRVPPDRLEEVAHHYDRFGGRSPLTALTRRQAASLEAALAAEGRRIPVSVGMRNWHPYLHETLAEMRGAGIRRMFGIVMAPHRSYASWEQYHENVADARAHIGAGAPDVDYAGPWFDHPGFIDAQADRVSAVLRTLIEEQRDSATLVFTAHSIPVAMAARSHYAAEFETSARLVASRLGHARWTVAYQSRSGDPREPWLEPDVNVTLRELADRRVRAAVIVPIGFVSDHIEVLYDLDTEARTTAAGLGIAYYRAATVMDHPAFIGMLAGLVAAASGKAA
jgi:protoporphyrin/coproporphyrin ferrochelatase